MNLAIITSAISVSKSDELRLTQTLHTIDSIRCKIPDVHIVLLECSKFELSKEFKHCLSTWEVEIIPFCKDEKIHSIIEESNIKISNNIKTSVDLDKLKLGYIKNLTELYVINSFLNRYDLSPFERIIKVSGRYFLTPDFNWENHKNTNLFCTSPKLKSNWSERVMKHRTARICTLWSASSKQLDRIKSLFLAIDAWIKIQYDAGLLGDIEHGLDLFLREEEILEIMPVGIAGMINNEKFIKN